MNGHLAVMYHYVWPDNEPAPGGIRPLLASEFERQLDWLEAHYQIADPEEFLRGVSREPGERPLALLTFDDGTRDHARVVTPILQRRRLSGVFFVLTWPLEAGWMPMTHAVHWLLGQDELSVWQRMADFAQRQLGGLEALGSEIEARRIYHYESPLRARIKYAANMALPPGSLRNLMQQAVAEAGVSLSGLASSWFASADDIRSMYQTGMTIGMHGCSHQSLATLSPSEIQQEIHHSADYLSRLLGQPPRWWACPFGASGASRETLQAMEQALDEVGIAAAVTTTPGSVPTRCDLRALPRMDCIALPPRLAFS